MYFSWIIGRVIDSTVELQLIELPKSNSTTCRHKELLDHAHSLVFYNIFSIVFSCPNTSQSQRVFR